MIFLVTFEGLVNLLLILILINHLLHLLLLAKLLLRTRNLSPCLSCGGTLPLYLLMRVLVVLVLVVLKVRIFL